MSLYAYSGRNTLKNWISLIFLGLAIALIGCGGGGGGGSSTDSTSTSTATNSTSTSTATTGITQGIQGYVRDVSSNPVSNARVIFFNSNGNKIKEVRTLSNGHFEAQLDTTAKRFTLDFADISNSQNYFHQFSYGDFEYLENDTSCTAKLPAFSDGQVKTLPTDLVITQLWFGPPSPPDGCVQG